MKKQKIKYAIPFNGDLELIEWAIESEQVSEVYFSGPEKYDFADITCLDKMPSFGKLVQLIDLCNKKNIRTNLLLNKKTMFFENVKKIIRLINAFEKSGRLDSVTISDPFFLQFLLKNTKNLNIQASIFMGIDKFSKAKEALKEGFSTICLDPSINRDYYELKKIIKLKEIYPNFRIKLLGCLNCFSNCFYAWEHPSIGIFAHLINKSKSKYNHEILGNQLEWDSCFFKREDPSDDIKKPFIRPEDVSFYEQNYLCDEIKIAYREDETDILKKKSGHFLIENIREIFLNYLQ